MYTISLTLTDIVMYVCTRARARVHAKNREQGGEEGRELVSVYGISSVTFE